MTAWIIFGENGQYSPSDSVPSQLLDQMSGWSEQDALVNAVYLIPNSDNYMMTDGSSWMYFYYNFPADVGSAAWDMLVNNGDITNISYAGPGLWAVFGPPGSYTLGNSVPQDLLTVLANYRNANQQDPDQSRYVPYNIVFAPSGEWLLIGYDEGDEGNGTYNSSSKFPSNILNELNNNLPDHVGA